MKSQDYVRFIENEKKKEFKWGESDCVLFVCDWINQRTKVDLAHEVRGKYTTQSHAEYLIEKQVGTLENGFDQLLSEVEKSHAQRGDIVLAEFKTGLTCGLVHNPGYIFKTENGLAVLRNVPIIKVWRLN